MTTKKQILLGLGGVFLLVVALAIVKFIQIRQSIAEHANFKPPPESVTTIVTSEIHWPEVLSSVGNVVPSQGVMLSAEESGKVTKIAFESGQLVEAGATLIELDTSVEEANYKGASAMLQLSKQEFVRTQNLHAKNAVSQAEFDKARASLQNMEAEVESLRATIQRKKIVAPFTGRSGIRLVNLGQYVTAGAPIVPLHALDPVFVNFSLPQESISKISVGQVIEVNIEGFGDRSFSGKVTAVNPNINENTRNLEIQATVPNKEEKLLAGMFAKVSVILPGGQNAIVIPVSSVNFAPYGDTVFVVEKMKDPAGQEYNGVRQQIVKLGEKRGNQVSIKSGLKVGEEVVTTGTFKLRPGAEVNVHNELAPDNNPAPVVEDT